MSKINLLPWREELNNLKNKAFYLTLALSVGCAVFFVFLVGGYFNYKIAVVNANIQYINRELRNATEEVSEVQLLKQSKARLLDKIRIIQSLQADRPSAVKLLDLIPRLLPEGIYLVDFSRKHIDTVSNPTANNPNNNQNALNQQKDESMAKYQVIIEGVALTNGSISVFLKNLEKVKWISDIKLNEVSINQAGDGLNFKVGFIQNLESGGA